jgi:APA family basic amino acid/polyamine antiporter
MNAQATDARLVRAVGTWGLAAAIVNITIGGGIFRLPARAAAELGMAAPFAYLLCAVAMALIVLCFAEAGSRVSATGGLYAYVGVALGPLAGFVTGVLLWAGITAATAAVASFFVDSVVALAPALDGSIIRGVILTAAIGGFAIVNLAGVKRASGVNALMTVAKLLPLLLLVGVGLFTLQGANFSMALPPMDAVTRGSAVLIFAFLGVESALVPSGEVQNPARTVPRAIFIAIAAVSLVYVCVQLVAQSALGPALATSPTPVADAAGVVLGPWGRTLILVGSSISMFGYVGAMTLAVPRLLYAFARDGFLPSQVASTDDRSATPRTAIVIQAVLHLVLALSGGWNWLISVANGAVLLMYATCCVALIVLRRRNVTAGAPPFVIPGGPVVPVLAFIAILWLLAGIPMAEMRVVLLVAGLSAAYYAVARAVRPRPAEASA